jgi:hypothetical protein
MSADEATKSVTERLTRFQDSFDLVGGPWTGRHARKRYPLFSPAFSALEFDQVD